MKAFASAIALSSLLVSGAAFADASTAVIDHHVANMKSGNLAGVLSDYAPNAVVVFPAKMITPSGVFVGTDVKTLFTALTAKDNLPGNKSMQTKYEPAGADTTIMHWVQVKGTPKEVSGYDVFVIRGGKVVFQSVTINAAK